MAKKNKVERTHIVVVLDRSGSMARIAQDMEGGLNQFVKDQREIDAPCTFTMAQFDDKYEVVHDAVDLEKVPELTLVPRGSTALLDAMGKTLTSAKEYVDGLPKDSKPTYKIVSIITDGMENASTEWSRDKVIELIKGMEEDGWVITYLGANQDAIQVGTSMGIAGTHSMTYDSTGQGVHAMAASYSVNTTNLRQAKGDGSFTEEQRRSASKT